MPAGFLPPVVAELRADISSYSASMAKAKGEMEGLTHSAEGSGTKLAAVGGKILKGLTIGAVGIGAVTLHTATVALEPAMAYWVAEHLEECARAANAGALEPVDLDETVAALDALHVDDALE